MQSWLCFKQDTKLETSLGPSHLGFYGALTNLDIQHKGTGTLFRLKDAELMGETRYNFQLAVTNTTILITASQQDNSQKEENIQMLLKKKKKIA